MLGAQYVADMVRCSLTKNPWQHAQFKEYFPLTPRNLYALIAAAGFDPEAYRNSWCDLKAALRSDLKANEHFVQFLDMEVKFPRSFPITVNGPGIRKLSRMPLLSRLNRGRLLRAILQAHIDFHPDCITSAPFWVEAFTAIARIGSPLVVCGDSHSLIYRQIAGEDGRIIVPLSVFCGGGSARGLANPNSRSGYGRRLEAVGAALAEASQRCGITAPVCFAFGQVDLEFVFNYRRIRDKDTAFSRAALDAFCDSVADTYVSWLATRVPVATTVLGINPPCLNDDDVADAYAVQMRTYVESGVADLAAGSTLEDIAASLRTLEFPPKVERTATHAYLNARLRAECRSRGLPYSDCFDALLGDDGCIEPRFACAAIGGVLEVGASGMDIHIGGADARRAKAALLDAASRASVPTP